MKAAVVSAFDHPPRYGSVPAPRPGDGRVVVDVLAAALSPLARSIAAGRHYTSGDALPLVPGVDGVGRTADGRLVYVLGLDAESGTMAERVAVDPAHLAPVPDGVDPVTAAAAVLPGVSSWVALRSRTWLEPGRSVLVLGATGVAGGMAVRIARALGAGRVVAAGRNASRLAALPADHVVPLDDPDALTGCGGVDVVLDYLWGPVAERILPVLARAARRDERPLRWVSIGSAAGPGVALPSELLRKADLTLLGSGQGSFSTTTALRHVPDLLAAVAAGTVTVDAHPVPLADVETAWTTPEQPGRRTVFTP